MRAELFARRSRSPRRRSPFEGPPHRGSPAPPSPDQRARVGGRRKEAGSERTTPYRFRESDSPHAGGDNTRPRPSVPCLPNPPSSPGISRSFRLLPPRPAASPTAPPNAAGKLLLWPRLRSRPARPPAGAKVSSTRRRKDAGPGLPGSSRAYLQGGRGLALQPSERTEPRRGRRGRKEARVRSTDQREKAA